MTSNNTRKMTLLTTHRHSTAPQPANLVRTPSKTSIDITTIYDKKISIEFQQIFNKAINFYSDYLFSNQLKKHLCICIEFNSTMKDYGYCEVLEYTHYKPRMFLIVLKKKKSISSMLTTLAHEMVHVKQYAYCELSENHYMWEGKDYSKKSYFQLPWEQQAMMLEHFLYRLYKEQYGHN